MSNIRFNPESCRFESTSSGLDPSSLSGPLSVILQVTRDCNFSCVFCSEIERMPSPTLEDLRKMRDHLTGVQRVYISGGEPLLRSDLIEVLDLFSESFVVGLPTNATILDGLTPELAQRVDFVNVGLDGPRNTTSRIRGDYDSIVRGVWAIKDLGIPLSLSCVVLSSTADHVAYLCQIADLLEARKVKLILPIPKGNALQLDRSEYLSEEAADALFDTLREEKSRHGWRPRISLTVWNRRVEGYSLLVFPDGETYAWPVYDREEQVLPLGNLKTRTIQEIWKDYPYKANHLAKYLGQSIRLA